MIWILFRQMKIKKPLSPFYHKKIFLIENECKASIGCHDRVHVLLNCSATTKKQITNPFSANPDEFFYFF